MALRLRVLLLQLGRVAEAVQATAANAEGEVGETCLEVPKSVATVFSHPPLLLGYRIRFIGQCSYRIRDYLIRDPIWHIRDLLYIAMLTFLNESCAGDE